METFVYQSSAITDLLNMLVKVQKNMFWKLRCSFADGQGQTIMEAIIYEGAYHKVKGRIVYDAESGKIKNFRYRGFKKGKNSNMIDLLLDLINFEKYQMVAAS